MNIIKFKFIYLQLLFIYCESKDMSNRKPTKCESIDISIFFHLLQNLK